MSEAHTQTAEVTLDEGVVVLRFRAGARLTGSDTAAVVEAHVRAAGGVRRPTLADIRGIVSADREARALAAGEQVAHVTSRLAVVVASPATRLIANFFLRVSSPVFPTRVFNDEASARAWLKESE